MKIHEYQGKELLAKHRVPVPFGVPAMSVEEGLKIVISAGSVRGPVPMAPPPLPPTPPASDSEPDPGTDAAARR